MRILVTGSSGQIGTNLALRLLADGRGLFGVDKRVNPYEPQVPIEDGIPRMVEWFLEHRAAHPDEDRPVEAEPAIGWKTLAAGPAS